MRGWNKFSHRIRSLFRRKAVDGELNEELKFHLEREIEQKIAAGIPAVEARRTTMMDFGAVESVREECRDMRKINWISNLVRDTAFGARMLRKNPGFTAIALLTLALGIGANAAIFTLVRGVLLRPLVNRGENRLIYIRQSFSGLGEDNATFSVPEINDIRSSLKTIDEIGDFSQMGFVMTGLGEPRTVRGGVVGGSYFEVMGLRPVLGRLLNEHDDGPAAQGAVVLTYHFWATALHSDPAVIGKTIRLESLGFRSATIVGVLEPCTPYPAETEIIGNLVTSPHHLSATMVTGRVHRMTELFGRLAPGATLDQARAELNTVYSTMVKAHPEDYPKGTNPRIVARMLRDQITLRARTVLLVLLAASGLIFIIACSNVANLILARTVRREGELSLRAALGATTGTLRRALLAENLLLCGAGALLGVLLARPMVAILARYAARFSVRALDLKVDSSMVWVGAGLAIIAAVLLAFVPRLPSAHGASGAAMSTGSVRIAGGTNRRLRLFAMIQIAASFVLIAGASMLVKTLFSLQAIQTGLDTRRILAVNVPITTYGKTNDQVVSFYRETLRRVRQLPGVTQVAVGTMVPWRDAGQFGAGLQFNVDGHVHGPDENDPRAQIRAISPGFFAALGVPILSGRDFDDSDRESSEPVVVISETVAQRMFPNQDAVDHTIRFTDPVIKFIPGFSNAPVRIVGVAADLDDEHMIPGPAPTIYMPFEQKLMFGGVLFVHTSIDPYALVTPVTRTIRELSPDQAVDRSATLADVRAQILEPDRLNTFVFGGFALVALTIAVVGVAGVLAFSVSARTREFGIRMALGAQPRQLLTSVIAEGAVMAGLGIVVGAAAGFALARLAGAYFEVMEMPSPLVAIAAAFVLLAAAVIASAMPALRAAHVDAIQALRAD